MAIYESTLFFSWSRLNVGIPKHVRGQHGGSNNWHGTQTCSNTKWRSTILQKTLQSQRLHRVRRNAALTCWGSKTLFWLRALQACSSRSNRRSSAGSCASAGGQQREAGHFANLPSLLQPLTQSAGPMQPILFLTPHGRVWRGIVQEQPKLAPGCVLSRFSPPFLRCLQGVKALSRSIKDMPWLCFSRTCCLVSVACFNLAMESFVSFYCNFRQPLPTCFQSVN